MWLSIHTGGDEEECCHVASSRGRISIYQELGKVSHKVPSRIDTDTIVTVTVTTASGIFVIDIYGLKGRTGQNVFKKVFLFIVN
jgi:hypothetical protein